jgi:predicted dehydrogenase
MTANAAASPVALGIVGCGRATQQLHLPALRHVPAIRVVALADLDERRLNTTAEQFGVSRRYTGVQALLDANECDAIAVCAPVGAHADTAVRALAAGKHVFVEKPLAVTLEDAERMTRAAESSRRVTALGFNFRCHRLVLRAREAIASGALGRVHQIVTTWGSAMQHEKDMPAWRRTRATGGGALFEIGIHHLDACAFLLDDSIAEIQLLSRSSDCEDESASVLARTRGGVLISSAFSQITAPNNCVDVVGDQGRLSFSLYRADSFECVSRFEPQYGLRARLQRLRRWREFPTTVRVARSGGDYLMSYREEWRRFAEAVQGGRHPPASFADGLAALRVVHAALESAEKRGLVSLSTP